MKTLTITKTLLAIVATIFMSAMISVATGINPAIAIAFGLTGSVILGAFTNGYAFDLITGTPITFNGKEARDGIIEPAYSSPELNEFMTIVEDVVAKEQIAFLGRITKVTQKDAGCGSGALNKTIPMTEKFWEPEKVKFWLTQCADDLENTFYVWGLSKGIERKDLTKGDFIDFVMDILTTTVKEDALRLLWFGDKSADTIANGSFLGSAGDIPFYDAIDGFWKQIFDAVTATTMQRVTISANAGVNYAAQALAAGASLTIFRGLMEGADSRLKSEPNKVILCTTSIWENWLTYKESQNLDMSFVRQEKGFQTDVYRGVKIYCVDFWDRNIDSDMNDGTAWVMPHRAIMTTKANLMAGFDASSKVAEIDAFLDKTTEINHMKGGYKVDAKIVFDFMTIAAY
jgi:hypothetical protein